MGRELGGRLVQRVLLHIAQHQVHAAGGRQARDLEAEARARAGDHRRLALVVLHAPVSFWMVVGPPPRPRHGPTGYACFSV